MQHPEQRKKMKTKHKREKIQRKAFQFSAKVHFSKSCKKRRAGTMEYFMGN